ncbi:pyrroline-5-carboxylate reductase 3-like [Hydractinia symbiolongicarpus]|uniref:pyrroline-5-carboxylate reductase 3-like n=1 Tax=Hydractinia symbiolongicarpus TaxID=13093 RepID=UPI00254FE2A7|nr:pyrroline-5-carboxylate reductase 3-like [Hydractinia symbiolongicarpus]
MYQTFKLPQIAFLGAGTLVEALTKGFVSAGAVQLDQVWASAPTERDVYRAKKLGCQTTTDNINLLKENKLVVLAVKPQVLPNVLREISPHVTQDHLLLSFAAGMKLRTMQYLLPPKTKLARLMTNTPVQYREGVSSFALGQHCKPEDRKMIQQLMTSVGFCREVKEDLLDTVTGFAGGGPAYAYCFIEAIADGAVLGGMNRDEALRMAAKTVLGAARMVEETQKHPGELKDAVCSGGGSTIHGIHAMEKAGMRAAVIDAVKAASDRSKELGKLLNESNGS